AFGRTSDGEASWSLFTPPTPGAANANPIANWVVNGAGYQTAPLAAGSIASAFAIAIGNATVTASETPLPTELGGVSIRIVTSGGTELAAPLYFVSQLQANFQVPTETPAGKHRLEIHSAGGAVLSGDILIV